MRPGETLAIRGCDLNMSNLVWEYEPENHKTEHHGKRRIIFLGPKAQAVVRDFLKVDLQAYLFSPRDGRADFVARKYRPGSSLNPTCGGSKLRDRYTIYSYRRAIAEACDKASPPPEPLCRQAWETKRAWMERLTPGQKDELSQWKKAHRWHPNQLRHSTATYLRREFGIEAARIILGHSTAFTTEIYSEMDREKARQIIWRAPQLLPLAFFNSPPAPARASAHFEGPW